jgi:hypothetical protein
LLLARRAVAQCRLQPRRPEETTLYQVVQDNLATLHGAVDDGALAIALPKFVKKELEGYLDRGLLCRRFARLRCDACEVDVAVRSRGLGHACDVSSLEKALRRDPPRAPRRAGCPSGFASRSAASTPDAADVPEPPDPDNDPANDGLPDGASTPPPIPPDGGVQTLIPTTIRYVIVLVKENHTFDNYFTDFPGAETSTKAKLSNKTTITRQVAADGPLGSDLCHSNT